MKEYYRVIIVNKNNKQLDSSKQFNTYDEARYYLIEEHLSMFGKLSKDNSIKDVHSSYNFIEHKAAITYSCFSSVYNKDVTRVWKWIIIKEYKKELSIYSIQQGGN